MVDRVRRFRREVEQARQGSRADIARELSLAITSLEDAEMRLTRALVRQARNAPDGDQAVDKLWEQLLADEDVPEVSSDVPEGTPEDDQPHQEVKRK